MTCRRTRSIRSSPTAPAVSHSQVSPHGRYTLVAEKTGFVRTRYGSRNDLDPPVTVDVGEAAAVDGIEYYVAAVDRLEGNQGFGEWQDPAFLESIAPRATRVTLAEGQSAAVTLRLIVR